MEVTPKAQIAELIRSSQNILILTHADQDGDAVGSSLALFHILKKLKKQVDMAMYGRLPSVCAFLPGYNQIKQSIEASNEIVITIDTRQTGEELKLGHKKLADEHRVMIVVSPSRGSLVPEDITVTRAKPKYDLVIFLDCSNEERIGEVHSEFRDLFFETPTVSIDHHPDNNYFAKVNWVDMTATSTAEMLVSLIESLSRDELLLDADVATCLLTGLVTDTNSFQNQNTTPKSLTVAAQLVAAGARQQEIVEKIFKTKPLSTLRLWGKILSNMREEKDANFVWAAVSVAEAASVGANPAETSGFTTDLLKSAAGVDFVLLFTERGERVHGSMRSVKQTFNVGELAKLMGGGGHAPAAAFDAPLEGSFQQAVEKAVATIKDHLKTRQAA